jgi:hypothetical protein
MPPTGHQVASERLEEFRRIYKNAYGEDISIEEARAMTHRLLGLYKLLAQPLPGETLEPAPLPASPAQNVAEGA